MQATYIHPIRVRQILFIGLILLLGYMLGHQLIAFLPAFLGALTLYILLRKPMLYLSYVRDWNRPLAAWLLMLASLLIILVPVASLVSMLSNKVAYVIQHANEFSSALQKLILDIEARFGITIINPENLNRLGSFAAQTVPKVLGATFSSLGTLFFLYFILYFMLVNGRQMENDLYKHAPLHDDNVDLLGKELQNMVWSNAIGIPVIAIIQGIVAIIGYYILGVKEPWFWFVLTCMTAMLPVAGAALAFVPVAIIFFANEAVAKGVIMLVFGFGVIGTVDNVLRFTLMKRIGNVHPLITVFGVIVGLQLFGFIGLIFGPLLISMFILLLKIYGIEFVRQPGKTANDKAG